ncbi:hypothetical protein [Cupriavidus gilardii]|uniref:hypothetical protein n=1 Tax=Cupriavidus gilardii TaxID=82541 RepID=UPI001580CF6F|nr:hypothetical protein [Cupriavidus gilardii]MCT9071650.1 hypothetical protein [Cupriavidus gilardii]QKS60453.1 hypothetical protein FOB47_07650 [Cupriavidus gilardii]
MATESRPGTESPHGGDPVGQRNDQGGSKSAGPTPAQGAPDAGGRNERRDGQRDGQGNGQANDQRNGRHDVERDGGGGSPRESDPAGGRDLPDENGEPPSVKRPGGNPEESEPPVENI